MFPPGQMRPFLAVFLLLASLTWAGPYIPAGDPALRHDIQRLADHGIVKGPTSTWPLAWGPIIEDIRSTDATNLSAGVADALARVRNRANWETRTRELTFNAKVAVAEKPTRIRSFQNTARGDIEVAAGFGWIDEWFSFDLNLQGVDSDQDSQDLRADDSMIGVVLGNWSVAASTQQRWWGPGWDGNLILGNNARPIPSLVIDRIFTDGFETKWLSWLGPWDLNVMFGLLEHDRVVPDTQFFGMRFNFRPIPSLEIGISRSAQWCGKDRPCDLDTFVDLLLGEDNRGGGGINVENEPGNQLAGLDFRWSPSFINMPVSFYGQFIGEDEAGGFPSRYIGQVGMEGTGFLLDQWSYRYFLEATSTSCDFWKSDEIFNCAYNHFIYETGYRFRDRVIGHGVDNDARLISAGIMLVDSDDTQWRGNVRYGELNRAGAPDDRNTLTPTPQDLASLDLSHSRVYSFGVVDLGVGYEWIDDDASGDSNSDGRFYVQWRSSY